MAKKVTPPPTIKSTLTEVTPETPDVVTTEMQQEEALRKTYGMFAASCDREATRIRNENCVRLGHSIINESSLSDAIVKILKEHSAKYLYYAGIVDEKGNRLLDNDGNELPPQ